MHYLFSSPRKRQLHRRERNSAVVYPAPVLAVSCEGGFPRTELHANLVRPSRLKLNVRRANRLPLYLDLLAKTIAQDSKLCSLSLAADNK